MDLRAMLLLATCILLLPILALAGRKLTQGDPALTVSDLKCEGLTNPVGIDATSPRLSWKMQGGPRGEAQTAFEILVAHSADQLAKGHGDVWSSGKVGSGQSIHVQYAGIALQTGKGYFWKVRVWNNKGKPSAWSTPASWSMGLLSPGDWHGKWIGLDGSDKTYHLTGTQWIWYPEGAPEKEAPVGARYFRREFTLPAAFTSASFHVAADNACTVFINGVKLCETSDHTYAWEADPTSLLQTGNNVCAIVARNVGEHPNPAGVTGLLTVTLTDGSVYTLATDSQWRATAAEVSGWQSTTFDDAGWVAAKVLGPVGMQPWGEKYGMDDRRLPARWLRKEFAVKRKIARATAYICGLGLSELYLNGKKVGDDVLSPALSEYNKRVYYVTHDVTGLLKNGANAIGVVLGNGRFYAPRLRQPTQTRTFGFPKLLLQLIVEFEDGSSQEVVSDATWKLTDDGPIRLNNEYDGEEYDARKELDGWAMPGYHDAGWQTPALVSAPGGKLCAQMINPIRVMETLRPIAVRESTPGVFIFDMGQNMVGWCRLSVTGPAGTHVTLRHAESLTPEGGLYLDNIRGALVTDVYTLRGSGMESYEPRFTYHGFRYVEVKGFPGRPDVSVLEGRVVHDDVASAGTFTCSNPVVNRTYKNIYWGVRGNYRSISTDCPQRDERQGWLGDRSAESRGETYLFDISTLYAKWVQDMADAQLDNGSVSDVCPAYWPLYNDNVTWPSSTVIIPSALLDQYADTALIRRHYDSMVKWIDHMSGFVKDGIITNDSYGDWCVPPEDPKLIHSNDPARKTTPGVLSTSFLYYDLCLMQRYARMLEKPADATRFGALADQLNAGLQKKYYRPDLGYYDNGSQTSCVLPLAFGMVPNDLRTRVFDHLVRKITDETHGHVGTGLIGGQWLNRVLSEFGRPDIAYGFATTTAYPSWGYMAEKGATTIWELWNGDSADPSMNSGNHVMLVGDLVIWFYENLAGIKPEPETPGFRKIIMLPTPVGDLHSVEASHDSPYGRIASAWKIQEGKFEWDVTVPVNCTATIFVPASGVHAVKEGGKPAQKAAGVKFVKMENGRAVFAIGSGSYHFISDSGK
jgi:alpha-L-rhamnosidase